MRESDVLAIVNRQKVTRREVAAAYGALITSGLQATGVFGALAASHVGVLNAAIIARWSESGLNWIKREAWKQIGEGR